MEIQETLVKESNCKRVRNTQPFNKYMYDKISVSRWTIIRIAIAGVFVGVLLSTLFIISGVVI